MMRSLYSGISGLKNHQTRMDIIGNNIANVNTIGYKTSRVVFQDIYSQTLKTGSAGTTPGADGTGGMGGTNPVQIGLGVKLSAIDIIHTSAPTQRTDNPLDLAIDGDGYFIVRDPATGNDFYTRAGYFKLDDKGNLVTTDGYFVMGYNVVPINKSMITKIQAVKADGTLDFEADNVTPKWVDIDDVDASDATALEDAILKAIKDGTYAKDYRDAEIAKEEATNGGPLTDAQKDVVYARIAAAATPAPAEDVKVGSSVDKSSDLTTINLAGYTGIAVDFDGTVYGIKDDVRKEIAMLSVAMFSNTSGLEKMGSSMYRKTGASGDPIKTTPQKDGSGRINGGGLEMSNVDLATEFTDMIVTQRGYQANSRIITVSDSMLEELVNLKR